MPKSPSPPPAPRSLPDLRHELALGLLVCGIDEAGRGPLAGPVVAAAVIVGDAALPGGIDDSKRLTAARREALYEPILALAMVGIGQASVAEIDRLNILHATMLAMRRAVAALPQTPRHALVDGNRLPALPCPGTALIGGDGLSLSIAAASIVAKVTRDRLMHALAAQCPDYGFEHHVGYATPEHLAALRRCGPSPLHRMSFAPVRLAAAIQRPARVDVLAEAAPPFTYKLQESI